MLPRRPRITFVTPHFGRATGGVGVSADRIVTSLAEHFDVDVVVPDRLTSRRSVVVSRIGSGNLHRLGGSPKDQQTLQFVTEYITRSLAQSDVIIAFSLGREAFAAAYGASLISVPFIACGRGDDIDLGIFTDDGWRLLFTLSKAMEIVAVSREMKLKIEAIVPHGSVRAILNGTDPILFPFHAEYRPRPVPLLGMFGEIKWKKGLDLALTTIRDSSLSLHIVGEIREEAQKVLHGVCLLNPEIENRIQHTPYTDSIPELVAHYHAVDIVCIPSYYDGTPNVLLEAMSCGKVCVAAAVGGCIDLIREGENGFLFTPGDSFSLKQAIGRAHNCIESDSSQLRHMARQTVERDATWEIEQSQYITLVQQVLETRGDTSL